MLMFDKQTNRHRGEYVYITTANKGIKNSTWHPCIYPIFSGNYLVPCIALPEVCQPEKKAREGKKYTTRIKCLGFDEI